MESAWVVATEWEWPLLDPIPVSASWSWLESSGFRATSIAVKPVHKALVSLLEVAANPHLSESLETIFLAQAFESLLMGGPGRGIGEVLKERIELILGAPAAHKKWLNDFYKLRSQVVHGSYPVIRTGVAADEEYFDWSKEFWMPLNRARAVLLALLQRLIGNGSTGFAFTQSATYIPFGSDGAEGPTV